MLFGIAGRKASGKSTAAKVFINQGCSRASFAVALKEYTCRLYGWSLEDVSTQAGKEDRLPTPVKWTEETCREFSKMANIDLPFDGEHVFENRRVALTTIGTDILRKHDPDFHIREFKQRFGGSGDYICDDIRFQNELKVMEELGFQCSFIVRPYHWDYSNHSSETSVRRKDFQTVLMNDRLVSDLTESASKFIAGTPQTGSYDELNHDAFYEITPQSTYWAGVFFGIGRILNYSTAIIEVENVREDLVAGFADYIGVDPKNITKEKSVYHLAFRSPYIVDDWKMWDIVPTNRQFGMGSSLALNPIPSAAKDNDELFRCWVDGLLEVAK